MIQDEFYDKLLSITNMPIQSRYVAFKLSQLGNTNILIHKQYSIEVGDNRFKMHLNVTGDKADYIIKILNIDVPGSIIDIVKS